MKIYIYILLFIIGNQSVLKAQTISAHQNKAYKEIIEENVTGIKPIPVPGSHLLWEKEKQLKEFYAQNPDLEQFPLSKPTSWGFSVGSTKEWWADYFEPSDSGDEQYLVPSTCRAVGQHCYIFVEDSEWNNRVDQAAVDAIVDAFDNSTPAPAPNNDGIFNVDTRTFGDPPNVDNDEKIIILILDIQDGYTPGTSTSYTAGYFYSLNERNDSGSDGTRSNEAEIFYMDCYPAVLTTDNGRQSVLTTTAHEFQHMIHWGHDDNESTFVNEGLSEIAEHVCGYGMRSNNAYAQNHNRNLLGWNYDDVIPEYSRAAHWTLYMYEQFGIEILKDFVDNTYNSPFSFNPTFNQYSPGSDFRSVYRDFLIANYLNDTSIDSKYGYSYTPRAPITPTFSHLGILNASNTGSVANQGANYITFSGGSDLSINFSNVAGTLRFCAVKTGTATEIEDIIMTNNSGQYTPAGYGTTYDKIAIIIFNVSTDGDPESYTYTSMGTGAPLNLELAYEDGTSDGSFGLATGDSIAVIFTGVSGGKLDSIKTYFRGTGKIDMDISKYDGNNFLRGKNIYNSTRNILTPDKWNKINLVSQNIDASDDFVVSYILGDDPDNPNIGVRGMPDTGEYHSRTYVGDDGQWWIYYYDDDGDGEADGYWNFLIRAYVSVGDGTVAIDQNGIVALPDEFNLSENYPNPFNPSTTFNFSTPKDGLVKFTVHDLLGRKIYSENRNVLAGNYSFTWDGQNNLAQQAVSGVYFLKMEADGFTQTRKMLMMK